MVDIDFSCHFRLETRSILMDRVISMSWEVEIGFGRELDATE